MEKPNMPQRLVDAAVAYTVAAQQSAFALGTGGVVVGWRLLDAFTATRRAVESTATVTN
jgi:hypothetical protein